MVDDVRFITADKVSGGQGFRAVWTEVKNGPGCDQFVCKNNSFCIAKHLECDGTVNCGFNDDSDEAHCNYAPFDDFDSFRKHQHCDYCVWSICALSFTYLPLILLLWC